MFVEKIYARFADFLHDIEAGNDNAKNRIDIVEIFFVFKCNHKLTAFGIGS